MRFKCFDPYKNKPSQSQYFKETCKPNILLTRIYVDLI